MHYETSGLVVMMCLLGGMGTFFGPFVGAAVFLMLIEYRLGVDGRTGSSSSARLHRLRAVFPKGLWGTFLEKAVHERAASCTENMGELRQIRRAEGITAEFRRGAITSIIGPNGAGKSTYFNLLSGAFPPSSGAIRFKGRDITGAAAPIRAYGRGEDLPDHQRVPGAVQHENIRVAAQAGRPATTSGPARAYRVDEEADAILAASASWKSGATARYAGARRAARAGDRDGAGLRPGCCCSMSRQPA